MSRKRGKYQIFGIFGAMQIFLLVFASNVSAPGYLYIWIQAQPPTVNINQSNEPVIIHCNISFEGISALPFTVYVEGSCDVGEVYLTQYQFVFHYTETVPFDAIVFINSYTENDTEGTLSIYGYYGEGGIQYNLGPVMQIIYVLNYDPNWTAEYITTKIKVPEFPLDPLYLFILPSLLLFFGIYKIIINPRMIKNAKKFKTLSDK